jgi:hypothetical protein
VLFLVAISLFLLFIVLTRGDKIQRVVNVKARVNNVAETSIIDAIYCVLLFYFKEYNKLPMSTTWVFLGLIGGREIGMSIEQLVGPHHDIWHALKLTIKDLLLAVLGMIISIIMVLINNPHYFKDF